MNAPEPSQIHAQEQAQYNKTRRSSNNPYRHRSSSGTASSSSATAATAAAAHPYSQYQQQVPLSPTSTAATPNIRVSHAPSTRPPSYHTVDATGATHRSRPRASSAQEPSRHQRNPSLPQRFPGDMSNRPLDIIRREEKAANRHPRHRSSHRRHRSEMAKTDTIDRLDTVGGAYHHDGPYDATLASRNLVEKYSPLAAVRDSNMEALRATPREYIQDSLEKHVPLQGTATIPNGGYDFSGKRMDYNEGADLMREPDAAGGAYKRWEGEVSFPA